MADRMSRFSVESGKGSFVKQRCRSMNWAELSTPGQEENRPVASRRWAGSGLGSRLDAEGPAGSRERARLAGLCCGGAPLTLEEGGRGEIMRILKDSQMASSPRMTYLGMSPPVRGGLCGGAANPLSQDSHWRRSARLATASSLQALQERDLQGVSFLRQGSVGDAKLLVASLEEADAEAMDDGEAEFVAGESPNAPFSCSARYFDL